MERSRKKLDFDHWLELAKDRQAFEALRRSMIDQVIEQAPESQRDRLRRLQWRIDQERRLSASPMGACIRISRMMWEQMVGQGGLVKHLSGLHRRGLGSQAKKMKGADVIPLTSGVFD